MTKHNRTINFNLSLRYELPFQINPIEINNTYNVQIIDVTTFRQAQRLTYLDLLNLGKTKAAHVTELSGTSKDFNSYYYRGSNTQYKKLLNVNCPFLDSEYHLIYPVTRCKPWLYFDNTIDATIDSTQQAWEIQTFYVVVVFYGDLPKKCKNLDLVLDVSVSPTEEESEALLSSGGTSTLLSIGATNSATPVWAQPEIVPVVLNITSQTLEKDNKILKLVSQNSQITKLWILNPQFAAL